MKPKKIIAGGKRDYKIYKDNNDKFIKWEDVCIAGIEYVINNLI